MAVIVMCINNKQPYVDQAMAALRSLRKNSPGMGVIIYLVNFNGSSSFNAIYENIKIKYVDNVKDVKEFMTSYSTRVMYEVMVKYKEPIIWLDADVIIRGNLTSIFEDVTSNTLKIVVRDNVDENSIFNTGVVVVGYSANTLKLLKECSDNAMANQTWFADQHNLYLSYIKNKDQIRLVNMPWKWNDLGGRTDSFLKDSVIWHCKGIHFDKEPFKTEYNFYLREVVCDNNR